MLVRAKVRICERMSPRYTMTGYIPAKEEERVETVKVFCPNGSSKLYQEKKVREVAAFRQRERMKNERTGLEHIASWKIFVEELISEDL